MGRLRALLALSLVTAGCMPAPDAPPGMRATTAREHALDHTLAELARVDPGPLERALLVVFPRSACSGSASAVIVDDRASYVGALPPGTAALLAVPLGARELSIVSSAELAAPIGTWHDARRIALPAADTREGIVLRSTRWSARECATGQYFDVAVASKGALEEELAESDVVWLEPAAKAEGDAWLSAHRARVTEVLTTPASGPPGDLTPILLR